MICSLFAICSFRDSGDSQGREHEEIISPRRQMPGASFYRHGNWRFGQNLWS
jgi:hypothetical protein